MTARARLTALLATLLVATAVVAATPAVAAPAYDGSTAERAAASCWEVKQADPSAPDGRYWLVTPKLQTPAQFYCDQTTDGGGWVLVGRGRHAWTEAGDGQGTTADVSSTVTGTGAFRAKQLSGTTVDGLLDGGRVDALADGVRLKRATTTAQADFDAAGGGQEVRFKLKGRDRWSWALPAGPEAGIGVSSYTVDGTTTTASQQTRDLRISTDTQRTWSFSSSSNAFVRGFSYGQDGPTGTDSWSSFLYSKVAGGQYATPFTQMYLRPKLTTATVSYPTVPDTGTVARSAAPVPESFALPNPWGVTGLGAGGTLDYATEVSAFAQVGNTVYVGGNFTTVQKSDGSNAVQQPYLAAFNATTGEWVPGFRPRLNNQVKALEVLPNGRLAVGGEFSSVNGSSASGLVVLSPTTGATYTTFKAKLTQTVKGAKRWVRTLDVRDNWLYVGGGFTRYTGGSATKTYALNNIMRVTATAGTPDSQWAPNLGVGIVQADGTRTIRTSVVSLDVSDDGKRVYAAGQFQRGYVGDDGKNEVIKSGAAAISTAKPATFTAWPLKFSSSNARTRYSQAVKQVGSRVWVGGSQHSLFAYNTSQLALNVSNVTLGGGDLQAIDSRFNIVYGSCHCDEWNYSGATRYDTPKAAGYTQVDRIGYVGAWNGTTGAYYPEFAPYSTMRRGEGPWALMAATDGTLWAGGDYTGTVDRDGQTQFAGGFVRYPMRPHTPPSAPSGLKVQVTDGSAQLTWKASSTPDVAYDVIRNNRVVGTTSTGTTSATVPHSSTGDRWFVRATDGKGNASASTPVAKHQAPQPVTSTLVAANAQWAYWFKAETPDAAWKTQFDDTGWAYGAAPLGFGSTGLGTTLTKPAGVVLARFRRTLKLTDVSDYSAVTVTTRADDGAVVTVNGTEVARRRVTGTQGYADQSVSTAAAVAEGWTFQVPLSLLRTGTNHIAVEVRLNSNSSGSLSHQAVVTGTLK